MSRRTRIDFEGAVHHVMNRGVNRQKIFFGDADRLEFGRRLADVHERFGVETLAYCLMENHFHLLLRTPNGGLPVAMQHLASVYTRHTNDRIGRDGPMFRARYHSIPVLTDSYVMWATRYIHRNALDLSHVRSLDSYRWSSYRTYLGHRRRRPFLNVELVMSMFGDDAQQLAAFTRSDTTLIGMTSETEFEDIQQLVRLAVARHDLLFGDDEYPTRILERTVLLLLADSDIDPCAKSLISTHLSFPSEDARRMALGRARKRCGQDQGLASIIDSLCRELQGRTVGV